MRRRTLTFCPSRSSLLKEHRMGNMGLALAWETRIPPLAQRGRRLEPYRGQIAPPDRGAEAKRTEDAGLAAACRSGDLHAYERLYSLHCARVEKLARNI